MNDLRHDPDAHTIDRRDPTWYAASDTATVTKFPKPAQAFAALREQFGAAADAITDPNARYNTPAVLTAEQLRTEPMPDLRTPQARPLDAARRGLDCRTADDKTRAELVRIVDALQALTLRVDVLIEDQARTIAELTAYIRDHSEAD